MLKLKNGFLITFEGIDGSGKTTLINKLKKNKILSVFDPIYTKEPMENCKTYNLLKEYISSLNSDPLSELFLFLVNHNEHLNNIIKPCIKNKKVIICDRYIDSRCAYQGATLKNFISNASVFLFNIHKYFSVLPDLTFYIYIDIEKSMDRLKNRSNIIKFENRELLIDVSNNFNKIINMNSKRFVILDGSKNIDQLEFQVVNIIIDHLSKIVYFS